MRNAFSRSVIAFEQNNSFELAYPFEADIRYVVKSVIINRLLLNKDFLIIIFSTFNLHLTYLTDSR